MTVLGLQVQESVADFEFHNVRHINHKTLAV
jgi:hypothetical protein